jgi:FdhE protein
MELYRQWYTELDRLPPLSAGIQLAEEEAARKLQLGTPLLHDLELPLHFDAVQQALTALLDLVARANQKSHPHLSRALLQLRQSIPSHLPLLAEALSGRNNHQLWQNLSAQYGLENGVLSTVITTAMRPAFAIWWRSVSNVVARNPWGRGYCPACGGGPSLAELQGKEGFLHLRCGMCGADWTFPRLRCHRCGNRDPQTLGILQIYDDVEKPFARTCSACGDYLKTLVCYAATPPELLPIEDLATLEVDFAAERAGFTHAPYTVLSR